MGVKLSGTVSDKVDYASVTSEHMKCNEITASLKPVITESWPTE